MKFKHVRKISEQAFNKLVEAVEAGKSETLIQYLKVACSPKIDPVFMRG